VFEALRLRLGLQILPASLKLPQAPSVLANATSKDSNTEKCRCEVTLQISGKIAILAFGSPAFGAPLLRGITEDLSSSRFLLVVFYLKRGRCGREKRRLQASDLRLQEKRFY
jgi:hypothetical protein